MKRIVADRESDLIPGKALCSSLIRQFKGVDGANEALEQIQCRGDLLYQT